MHIFILFANFLIIVATNWVKIPNNIIYTYIILMDNNHFPVGESKTIMNSNLGTLYTSYMTNLQ